MFHRFFPLIFTAYVFNFNLNSYREPIYEAPFNIKERRSIRYNSHNILKLLQLSKELPSENAINLIFLINRASNTSKTTQIRSSFVLNLKYIQKLSRSSFKKIDNYHKNNVYFLTNNALFRIVQM